jgi:hypothetical protein
MLDGFMQQMRPGGATAGDGSFCCSSYSCCSRGGPGGQTVSYSTTTTGARRSGEPMISETQASYYDSTGIEKLGVSRNLGERGRRIVAERDAHGEERQIETLVHVEDPTAFDREWLTSAQHAQLPRVQHQLASSSSLRPAAIAHSARATPRAPLTKQLRELPPRRRTPQQEQLDRIVHQARASRPPRSAQFPFVSGRPS